MRAPSRSTVVFDAYLVMVVAEKEGGGDERGGMRRTRTSTIDVATSSLHRVGVSPRSRDGEERLCASIELPADVVRIVVALLMRDAPWDRQGVLCARRLSRVWRDCIDASVRDQVHASLTTFYAHMPIQRRSRHASQEVLAHRRLKYFLSRAMPSAVSYDRYRCARCGRAVDSILDGTHACIRPRTWVQAVLGPAAALIAAGLVLRRR